MGKTLWARSLGNHAYFGGLFSLQEEVSIVDYAVFDDITADYLTSHNTSGGLDTKNNSTPPTSTKGNNSSTGVNQQYGCQTTTHGEKTEQIMIG